MGYNTVLLAEPCDSPVFAVACQEVSRILTRKRLACPTKGAVLTVKENKMKKLVAIGVGIALALIALSILYPDEITQSYEEIVMDKRFTVDGWEILDSCVTTTYAQFRMQGLAMQGYPCGYNRMETPCDSNKAYYLVADMKHRRELKGY